MLPHLRPLLLIVLLSGALSGCREEGGVTVASISFEGNRAVSGDDLQSVIATRAGGFLPWNRQYPFQQEELDRDRQRILAYYAERGYPDARVVNVDVDLNREKTEVDITVTIEEGTPVLIAGITFEGLEPAIPEDHMARLRRGFPITAGEPRDQREILASHDMVLAELRDHGFPYAGVRVLETPVDGTSHVRLAFNADPGPAATFGEIVIEGDVSVGEDVIRRELGFSEGDLYQLSRLTDSQRRLYGLELFQFVNITPRLGEQPSPSVPVTVTVAEGRHRRLQLGLGYGSEEKVRARINWRHVNFFGGARTGETEARWSSLEQGVRGSFIEPFVFQRGLSLRVSGSTWWSKEPIYESRSTGARIVLNKDFSRVGVGAQSGVRNAISATVIREYQDYSITDAALRDPTFRDELIALGLDPDTGRGKGTLSALAVDFSRSTSTQPLNPRQGYTISGHIEAAGALTGGSFTYNEVLGEVRTYLEISPNFVWANRARSGTLAGSVAAEIPFYKRYFVGGSSSVRGWGRYQVSPLSPAGLPIGGRTMMEVSTEARFGIKGRLSGVLFVDGGNVWREAWDVQLADLRWAAGPGIRYDTPIGPVRLDVGVQLNPISGLVIEGAEERRKWRAHFSIGQAF